MTASRQTMTQLLDAIEDAGPFHAARLARQLQSSPLATELSLKSLESSAVLAEQTRATLSQLTASLSKQAELINLEPLRDVAASIRHQAEQFERFQFEASKSATEALEHVARSSHDVAELVGEQTRVLSRLPYNEMLEELKQHIEKLEKMVKEIAGEQARLREMIEE